MLKKCLAILLSLLLMMTVLPPVGAEVMEGDVTAYPDVPCIVVSQAAGKRGDTVDVTISVLNNPGIISAKVKVWYDTSVLKLVGREAGNFPEGGYSWSKDLPDSVIVNWMDALNPDVTADLLATLTFEVLEGAAYGPSALTLEYHCDDDMFNENWETIVFEPIHGEVFVLYPVTGVALDKTAMDLYTGDTATLTATAVAAGRADDRIVWSVADTAVATVDENGVVTAKGIGSTTVVATSVDGGYTASCTVNVACPHRHVSTVDAVSSTCVVSGHDAYTRCNDCGEVVAGSDADLPLLAHNYTDEVIVEATCGAEGQRRYTCAVCGDSYTVAIPTVGPHTYPYSCSTACEVCGLTREAEPHKYSHQYDAECNICNGVREVSPIPNDVSAFVVDRTKAHPGEDFVVAIRTRNNVGVCSLKLKVHYDRTLFELISYEAGVFTPLTSSALDHEVFILNWCDATDGDNATDGVIAYLTFRLKEGVVNTESVITLTYDHEDVYNTAWEGVYFKTVEGVVEVTTYAAGDANGDTKINNRDLGMLQQHLNDWSVQMDVRAMDVNNDGKVNNRDLGLLQQYLNDWDVVLK